MTIDQLVQVPLFTLGVAATALANMHSLRLRRAAPIVGLCNEPFWFATAWLNGQWGVMALACVYTGVWGWGLYNLWWRRARPR